jgi:hypothetical protein
MKGDDAVRHCGACDKNVYNLSEMSTVQVEALLRRAGDTPCIRFYQRHDGTVMTGDCPVGAKAVRRKRSLAGIGASALAALGLALSTGMSPASADGDEPSPIMGAVPAMVEGSIEDDSRFAQPPPDIRPDIRPEPRMGRVVMGEPALPPDLEPR